MTTSGKEDFITALERVREVLEWGRSCGHLLDITEVEGAVKAIEDRVAEVEAEKARLSRVADLQAGHSAKQSLRISDLEAQVPRWTPVAERLPEAEGLYLVRTDWFDGKRGLCLDWFDGENFHEDTWVARVTDWMAIPEFEKTEKRG